MGDSKQRQTGSKAELLAFHSSLIRSGMAGRTFSISDWEVLMVTCLDTMTKKSCNDKTWGLQQMGLIKWEKRVGITVLEKSTRIVQPMEVAA